MIFKLKKAAAILAASAICFSCTVAGGFSAYADDEEGISVSETEDTPQKSEPVDSADGMWQYTITKDDSGNESACIEKYYGDGIEINIPSEIDDYTVTSLGDYALYENTAIEKVIIPASVTDIGRSAFFGCTSLVSFEVNSANENFTEEDGILFSKNKEILTCLPPGRQDTEYNVPDGVRALGPSAFAVCKSLKKIQLPESLELIDFYCFAECESLDNVVLPEKTTDLGMFAFTGCTGLKNITLPRGLTIIEGGAFACCTALKDIELPDSLQTIGQGAFVSTGLIQVEIPVYVQEIGYSAFGYTIDENNQIIPMDKFTVKGVSGSAAQSYCAENENVEFSAIDSETTAEGAGKSGDSSKNDSNKETGISKNAIIGIAVGAGIAFLAALFVVFRVIKIKKRNKPAADSSQSSGSPEPSQEPVSADKPEEDDQ